MLRRAREDASGGTGPADNQIWKDAGCDDEQGQNRDDHSQGKWGGRRSRFEAAGRDVDLLQHLEVVVKRHGAHRQSENEQPEYTQILGGGSESGGEEIEFAEEASQWGNAREGEHEHEHAKGQE